jgi:hypothetical protein
MPKGKHGNFERIRLDDQLYLLRYDDGRIKVVLQEGTLVVTEVMTRSGESTPGSHVFMTLRRNTHPKTPKGQQPVWKQRGFVNQTAMEDFEARTDFPGWENL